MGDFDLKALHTALDEQRRARGLTWAETTREISARNRVSRTRPVASSTITGLRTKRLTRVDDVVEATDGRVRPAVVVLTVCLAAVDCVNDACRGRSEREDPSPSNPELRSLADASPACSTRRTRRPLRLEAFAAETEATYSQRGGRGGRTRRALALRSGGTPSLPDRIGATSVRRSRWAADVTWTLRHRD